MAVQEQYSSPAFRAQNYNSLKVFHLHHQLDNTIEANMLGDYNKFVGQHVPNDPDIELTGNIYGRLKRIRRHFQLAPAQQRLQTMLRCHQPLSKVTGSPLTTSCFPSMVKEKDLSSFLQHQNFEIETLIQLQNEKSRLGLEELRKRHCTSLMRVFEHEVQKTETKLANANRINTDLQEKLKQIISENHMWFNVVRNNEAIASSLKSSLEQIVLQNQNQIQNENQDTSKCNVDEARPCCHAGRADEEDGAVEFKHNKSCKVCHKDYSCILVLPCRHLCLCKHCEIKLDACPICKCYKQASLEILFS